MNALLNPTHQAPSHTENLTGSTVAALSDGPHGLSVGLTVPALDGSPADTLVAVVEDGLRRLAKQIHRTDTAGPASTAVGLDRAVAPGWR